MPQTLNHFSHCEIGQCALCQSIIYDNDNFVVYDGILFCTESCKIEALENLETDRTIDRDNSLEF